LIVDVWLTEATTVELLVLIVSVVVSGVPEPFADTVAGLNVQLTFVGKLVQLSVIKPE
jgi:uncharacterized protein (DUF697 family)